MSSRTDWPSQRADQEVLSPWDGTPVGRVRAVGPAEADDLLAAAAALHARGEPLPRDERAAVLRRAAQRLDSRSEEFAHRITAEGGKPLTDARVEVARAVDGLLHAAHTAAHHPPPVVPMGATAASRGRLAVSAREPIGAAVAISAFNHPLNLIVHQVAPAVAAGCPVLVKPASTTPLSCLALVDVLVQSGLPPGWARAVPCENSVAAALAADARVAHVSFIGSARVGWRLRSLAAPGTRVSLEHGGAAPLLVDRGADVELAARLILKGGYYHAGQVCVSVQRVFADRAVRDDLVGALAAGVAALDVGDPAAESTDVGPLILEKEADRVAGEVHHAVRGGAVLLAGGARLGRQLLEPTLLADPPDDATVMTEEVFGPVVSVCTSSGLDESVRRANAVPWAFQAAVVSRDIDRALAAAGRLDATTVLINDHTAFRTDWMPFGGRGRSGLGLGGIPYSYEELTQPKTVIMRTLA